MFDSLRVGDRVQIKANGGSPAARKHAGAEGQVRLVCEGSDKTIFDVRIFGKTSIRCSKKGICWRQKEGRSRLICGLTQRVRIPE